MRSEKLRIAANDLCSGLGHPIRLGLAIGVRRPVVAAPVVVGLWAEHHPASAADRQRSLPEVKAASVQAALPWLAGLRAQTLVEGRLYPPRRWKPSPERRPARQGAERCESIAAWGVLVNHLFTLSAGSAIEL